MIYTANERTELQAIIALLERAEDRLNMLAMDVCDRLSDDTEEWYEARDASPLDAARCPIDEVTAYLKAELAESDDPLADPFWEYDTEQA